MTGQKFSVDIGTLSAGQNVQVAEVIYNNSAALPASPAPELLPFTDGPAIRKLREERGLAPSALVAKAKGAFDERWLTAAERGAGVGRRQLGKLATLLEVPFDDLILQNDQRPPYRGLLAFEAEDEALFGGREMAKQEILGLLSHQPLVAVVGASGSGKSSVVKAGVIAHLHRQRNPSWRVLSLKPGGDPLLSLAGALGREIDRDADVDAHITRSRERAEKLFKKVVKLSDYFTVIVEKHSEAPPKLLLFVDQWEELYSSAVDRGRRRVFLDHLLEAFVKSSHRLILTMRADFMDCLLDDHLSFYDAIKPGVQLLPKMKPEELAISIRKPEEVTGLKFEEGLVEAILKDAGEEPGVLALVEFTLTQLWEQRDRNENRLTLAAYSAIGGLKGAIDRHADAVYERLSPELHGSARCALLQLVHVSTLDTYTRTRRVLSELETDEQEVLRRLAEGDSRLVVISYDIEQAAETVEVAHEALIREWKKLKGWVAQDPGFLQWREEVERRRKRYEKNGKKSEDLLQGLDLQEAKSWLVTRTSKQLGVMLAPTVSDIPVPVRTFVDASNEHQVQTELKRRLARRRFTLGLAGASILFFVLTVCLGVATWLAQTQKQIAIGNETRALVALSDVALANHRPVDALKLAVAAWPRKGDDTRPALEATLIAVSNVLNEAHLPAREFKHNEPVLDAAFMKDETRILSWSLNALRLWDITTGQPIGPPMVHNIVRGVLINTDQTRIVSWPGYRDLVGDEPGDKTLRLWNATTGHQIGLPMHHDGLIGGALFSKDSTRILSWSDDNTARLWDSNTAGQLGAAMRHDGPVNTAHFSEDSSRIVSWSGNVAYLWDAATGEQIGQPMRHETPVAGALFSKDGSRILSWTEDDEFDGGKFFKPVAKQEIPKGQILRVWSSATALPVGSAMHHDDETGGIYGALLTKDGTRILSWAYNTLRLWQSTGQPIGPIMRQDGPIAGALFTRDETRILSWSNQGTLAMWDAATGRRIGSLMSQNGAVSRALFSKDEGTILSWSYENDLRLWNSSTGKEIVSLRHDGNVHGAVFNKNETRILSWSGDSTLRLWNTVTGQPIGPPMYHDREVNGALFNKDESRILSWSSDGTVSLWDCSTGEVVGSRMSNTKAFGALFAEDYKRIVTSSAGTVQVWDVATDQPVGQIIEGWSNPVIGSRLSKDKTRILSRSESGTLRVWDIATARPIGQPIMTNASGTDAIFSKDETHVLSWSDDGGLRLWDAATGQQIGETMKHGGPVAEASFNNRETRVLSWSEDRTLKLWDAATGQPIGEPMNNDGPLAGALFSDDDTRIFSWSHSHLRLWDAATGVQIGKQMNFSGFVSRVLVNRDSTRALSWSEKELNLWDIAKTQPINSHMRHNGRISSAMFNKEGTRVLSWSNDGTLQLWDATTGQRIGSVMNHESVIGGALFTRDETRILSWSVGRYGDDARNDGKEYTLRLWDAASQRQIGATMHHDYPINGAMFSEDEARIVSWSNDKTLRLWDVATTRLMGRPFRHDENVDGASFNKDQTRILSMAASSQLLNIDWPHGNLLELACELLPDLEVTSISQRYAVSIDPICAPYALPSPVDWSKIERAPSNGE
ncbi:WD40 repeat domain-containing protein [Rhizobium leguminosarum]|uniref:WD40 repeat domain-containing protein n=1 Tax=Rhizobium TaxID=379 RepID=UPI0013BD508E|nr:WD40 repeat domain-containing protein [Rhizobium leguminosarum]MBY5389624.1 WD40 repeat domain-containing protein [Rhizobium leguminosarum]MBY5433028.1 WD40 repeat domain-containing protein [Rhizobium leguminosarum]NEK44580.1 hypothetical protein [Rhizobium leguminosarum]